MKELKEQIIEALQDAIDTETGQVSVSFFDALLDGVLTEALRIHAVSGLSEQLCHCGEREIQAYSPCCSFSCWSRAFE